MNKRIEKKTQKRRLKKLRLKREKMRENN